MSIFIALSRPPARSLVCLYLCKPLAWQPPASSLLPAARFALGASCRAAPVQVGTSARSLVSGGQASSPRQSARRRQRRPSRNCRRLACACRRRRVNTRRPAGRPSAQLLRLACLARPSSPRQLPAGKRAWRKPLGRKLAKPSLDDESAGSLMNRLRVELLLPLLLWL